MRLDISRLYHLLALVDQVNLGIGNVDLIVVACVSRGAGQEVGRSCIILEFKGRKIMVKQNRKIEIIHAGACSRVSFHLAGLWDPSRSGGNGCSTLHRPD